MLCVSNQDSQPVALYLKKTRKFSTKCGDVTLMKKKSYTIILCLSAFRKWIKYKQDKKQEVKIKIGQF